MKPLPLVSEYGEELVARITTQKELSGGLQEGLKWKQPDKRGM